MGKSKDKQGEKGKNPNNPDINKTKKNKKTLKKKEYKTSSVTGNEADVSSLDAGTSTPVKQSIKPSGIMSSVKAALSTPLRLSARERQKLEKQRDAAQEEAAKYKKQLDDVTEEAEDEKRKQEAIEVAQASSPPRCPDDLFDSNDEEDFVVPYIILKTFGTRNLIVAAYGATRAAQDCHQELLREGSKAGSRVVRATAHNYQWDFLDDNKVNGNSSQLVQLCKDGYAKKAIIKLGRYRPTGGLTMVECDYLIVEDKKDGREIIRIKLNRERKMKLYHTHYRGKVHASLHRNDLDENDKIFLENIHRLDDNLMSYNHGLFLIFEYPKEFQDFFGRLTGLCTLSDLKKCCG